MTVLNNNRLSNIFLFNAAFYLHIKLVFIPIQYKLWKRKQANKRAVPENTFLL